MLGFKDFARTSVYSNKLDSNGKRKLLMFANTANSTNFTLDADTTEAMARGTAAIVWRHGRTLTFDMTFQVMSMDWLAILAGQEGIEKEAGNVHKRVVATVGSTGIIPLGATPVSNSITVTPFHNGGLAGASLVEDIDYKVEGNTIELEDTVEASQVLVTFFALVQGLETITINADKFPGSMSIHTDAKGTLADGSGVEWWQFEIPNANPEASVTLTFGDSVTEVTMSFTGLQDINTGNMLKMAKIPADVNPEYGGTFGVRV